MIDDASKTAKLQQLSSAMDFITKHFAVLSVAMAVFGAASAIIFIDAYLRVFDSQIIWIIEYPDVLKIGLMVIALFSAFSFWVWSAARDAIDLSKKHERSWLWIHLSGVLLWCLSLAHALYLDYHSTEPHYAMHVWLHFAFFAVIALGLTATKAARDFPNLTATQVAWITFIVVANISTLGTAFGYYTRDGSGHRYDVFLKERDLHEVRLVMTMPSFPPRKKWSSSCQQVM
jgi:hypothetical protein